MRKTVVKRMRRWMLGLKLKSRSLGMTTIPEEHLRSGKFWRRIKKAYRKGALNV